MIKQTTPAIELHGICNRFGSHVVHEDLDLVVRRGEILSLVGGSGSGKTVLLNCMIGLRTPTGGDVTVLGQPLTGSLRERQKSLRGNTGVLFQHGALFTALSVAENVAFPIRELHTLPPDIERELVKLKLADAGLQPADGAKMPAELSGGMVKRAALARALVLDPSLLYLDEPTSGLDPVSARAFVDLVRATSQSQDLTVVMVTHDVATVKALSDRVAVLADRKIVALGTVAEVMRVDHPFIRTFFELDIPTHNAPQPDEVIDRGT